MRYHRFSITRWPRNMACSTRTRTSAEGAGAVKISSDSGVTLAQDGPHLAICQSVSLLLDVATDHWQHVAVALSAYVFVRLPAVSCTIVSISGTNTTSPVTASLIHMSWSAPTARLVSNCPTARNAADARHDTGLGDHASRQEQPPDFAVGAIGRCRIPESSRSHVTTGEAHPLAAMTASGFNASASTCRASLSGNHSSSASRNAISSPSAAAMPSFMAALSP